MRNRQGIMRVSDSCYTWLFCLLTYLNETRVCQKLSTDFSFLYQFKCIRILMKCNRSARHGNFQCKVICNCTFRVIQNIMYQSFKGIHLRKSIYWFEASLTTRIGLIQAWSWEAQWSVNTEFTDLPKKLEEELSVLSIYMPSTRFQS